MVADLTSPQASATAAVAASTTPGRSSLARGPWLSGSLAADSAAATRPTGTFSQKIQCQSRPCTTAPPMSGPPAIARPPTAPQMPTVLARRSRGKAEARIVRLSGVISAAPSPWTARAAISRPVVGASAHAADATVKASRPTT